MKTHFIVLVLSLFICASVFAQVEREDVIYLKNGSIYRGTIIEQIPGVSYKIEILGGTVILVPAADVAKITKEERQVRSESPRRDRDYESRSPQPKHEFSYRPRGYFFQGQVEAEALEFGFRVVNGYKFGQFGYLGLGVGVDGVILDLHGSSDYSGPYFPIYVYYGGDILKKQITPFYSIEAGYAFHPFTGASDLTPGNVIGGGASSGNYIINSKGGLMCGAGFGVRFYSRRKVHIDLSGHLDVKQSFSTYEVDGYNSVSGYSYTYNVTEHEWLLIPGLRFGIGF